jgi:hypothetical protein
METVSAIALSLALGAGAIAGKEIVSAAVKDAYKSLRTLIMSRYPKVSIEQLEQAPQSRSRRAVVEEDLTVAGAASDASLAAAARAFVELVQQNVPTAAAAIGVELKDVEAANLRLADIAASGSGVLVEHGKFVGDIDIRGVRAGSATLQTRGGSTAVSESIKKTDAVFESTHSTASHVGGGKRRRRCDN